MKHGNILAILDADETMIASVENIVVANATKYRRLGSLFYIATADIDRAGNIVEALENLDVAFLFYYNNISTGSAVVANEGNPDLKAIKKILL